MKNFPPASGFPPVVRLTTGARRVFYRTASAPSTHLNTKHLVRWHDGRDAEWSSHRARSGCSGYVSGYPRRNFQGESPWYDACGLPLLCLLWSLRSWAAPPGRMTTMMTRGAASRSASRPPRAARSRPAIASLRVGRPAEPRVHRRRPVRRRRPRALQPQPAAAPLPSAARATAARVAARALPRAGRRAAALTARRALVSRKPRLLRTSQAPSRLPPRRPESTACLS